VNFISNTLTPSLRAVRTEVSFSIQPLRSPLLPGVLFRKGSFLSSPYLSAENSFSLFIIVVMFYFLRPVHFIPVPYTRAILWLRAAMDTKILCRLFFLRAPLKAMRARALSFLFFPDLSSSRSVGLFLKDFHKRTTINLPLFYDVPHFLPSVVLSFSSRSRTPLP